MRLNTTALKDAGREYIAVTLVHEFVHAYMSTFQANGARQMGPLQQHDAMVSYIDPMARFLNTRYNVPMDEAIALSWGGLEETNGYISLSDEEKNRIVAINNAYKNGTKGRFKCPKE